MHGADVFAATVTTVCGVGSLALWRKARRVPASQRERMSGAGYGFFDKYPTSYFIFGAVWLVSAIVIVVSASS